MGKRRKGYPTTVKKPGDNEKGKPKPVDRNKSNSSVKSSSSGQSGSSDSGLDEKLKLSKVVIDYNCRLLAEEALCKTSEKSTKKIVASGTKSESITEIKKALRKSPVKASSNHQKEIARDKKSQPSKPVVKPDPVVNPTARRRRKALTQALRNLRKGKTVPKPKENKQRASLRLSSPLKRSLRIRNSSISKEKEKVCSPREKKPKRTLSIMDYEIKDSDERESSPSVASNNISLSSSEESDEQTDSQNNNEDNESSDSDDDIEMQVLEKQVESEKEEEEDDGPPEVSFNLPDDTDEESSLLSPSALPASQLFRSPSSRRKKRKSSEKPKKQEISTPVLTSTPVNPCYMPRTSTTEPLPSTSTHHLLQAMTPINSSSMNITPRSVSSIPEKRGRGRPRKNFADVKSVSRKLCRKKLDERLSIAPANEVRPQNADVYDYDLHHSQEERILAYSSSSGQAFDDFEPDSAHRMEEFYGDGDEMDHNESGGDPANPENVHERLQRWKDRSTFVYARHKFVSNENKFRCDVCQVSFTALSSLKRHYGTIYHKQQEAAGGSTLDLSDILRPERDGSGPDLPAGEGPSTSSNHPVGRGRGRGRPPLARTTSFVRRSAVDNIKKYYAAADAARRRRENNVPFTATSSSRTWLQKQQRKRKPLLHSDYLYPSASADSEDADDDDDDFGCEDDENNENYLPEIENDDSGDIAEDAVIQTPWLSNVWKGIGPPHFTCEVCDEKFTKKFEFTKHLFQHRQEEARQLLVTCPECQAVHPNEQMLEQHFDDVNHGIGVIRDGRSVVDVKKLTCSQCTSKFARRDYYRKHVEVHKRPRTRCPHCVKTFVYKFYLSDHIKAKHDGWTNLVTNGSSSNSNNNGIIAGIGGISNGNHVILNNPVPSNSNGTVSNAPKPKVELYSSTTQILTSVETNKRRNSTSAASSNEIFSFDDAVVNDSKRKSSTTCTSAGVQKLDGMEILVPTFSISDPFTIGGKERNPESDISRTGSGESNPTSDLQSTMLTSSSTIVDDSRSDQGNNLLQKFFDSQKEQTPQALQRAGDSSKFVRGDHENKKQTNLSSTPSRVSAMSHSTTEDGKIVFQLEHSNWMGMDGDENACNMSPLTIEIPRDNINMDAEGGDGGTEEIHESEASNYNFKMEERTTVNDQDSSSTDIRKISSSTSGTEDNEKLASLHSTNSNSSSMTTSSTFQSLGCGVKMSLGVQIQPDNELQCQDCGKLFEHRKSLIKHVRYYSQEESYSCPLCDKSFKLKHHVSRHIKSFHNLDNSSTASSASDEAHLPEDHGEIDCSSTPPPSTSIRGSTTTFSSTLMSIPFSLSTSTPTSMTELPRKDFCAATSSFSATMKRSLSTDKSGPSNVQKERKRCASDASKRQEQDNLRDTPSSSFSKSNYTTVVDSNGATVFKCLICKKLYPSKHQISSHLSYHKRTMTYKCSVCNAEFKFKHDLNTHQQVHDSEPRASNSFICEKCPKINGNDFLTRKDLMKHMREKHNLPGRKPVAAHDHPNVGKGLEISRCPFCPLVFPQESDMQTHISLEHNSSTTVVCRRCGQILGSADLLKEHMIQDHSGDEDDDEDLGGFERERMEDDDDQPPTPSPHSSTIDIMQAPSKETENEPQEGEEAEPSSPESELMEVN